MVETAVGLADAPEVLRVEVDFVGNARPIVQGTEKVFAMEGHSSVAAAATVWFAGGNKSAVALNIKKVTLKLIELNGVGLYLRAAHSSGKPY